MWFDRYSKAVYVSFRVPFQSLLGRHASFAICYHIFCAVVVAAFPNLKCDLQLCGILALLQQITFMLSGCAATQAAAAEACISTPMIHPSILTHAQKQIDQWRDNSGSIQLRPRHTHLGIHRADTHLLFIKHSLMYLESMEAFRGSGANQDSRLFSIICILSLLYMATKLFRHENCRYVKKASLPHINLDGLC